MRTSVSRGAPRERARTSSLWTEVWTERVGPDLLVPSLWMTLRDRPAPARVARHRQRVRNPKPTVSRTKPNTSPQLEPNQTHDDIMSLMPGR